jgi:O-acetylserine/cysteine efflux transporter
MIGFAEIRLLLVAVTLFGGAWPITKSAMVDASPLWFAVSRTLLGALVVGLALTMQGRLRLPRRRDLPAVMGVGLLQLGCYFALTHLAVALVPAGRTAVLANVTIYWLVPLSVLVLGEKVSATRWLAAMLGLAGVLVLAAPWAIRPDESSTLTGYMMLLGASFLWSWAIIVTRRFPAERPMLDNLPWCFLMGGVVLVPMAVISEPLTQPGNGVGLGALWQVLVIGCVVAPLGTWAVIEAGRRLPGAVSSVGFLLAPAIGVVVSTLWLGEPLGWDVIMGGALIGASVLVATRG